MLNLTIRSHHQHCLPSYTPPSSSPRLLQFLVSISTRALRRRKPSLHAICHVPRPFLLLLLLCIRPPNLQHIALQLHRRCRPAPPAPRPPFMVRATGCMALRAAPGAPRARPPRDVARRRDLWRERRMDDLWRSEGAERRGRRWGEPGHVPRVRAESAVGGQGASEEAARLGDWALVGEGEGDGREGDACVVGYEHRWRGQSIWGD